MNPESPFLRAHDYDRLIRRWQRVATLAQLDLQPFSQSAGFPLFVLQSRPDTPSGPALYFSAGIHGDEPAATEGLVTWAEQNTRLLRRLTVAIFPCLNPWGLVNNNRLDSQGRDLNRCFGKRKLPQVRDQVRWLRGLRFDAALTLHEDYDARGIYIYEVAGRKPFWAEELLAAAEPHVPADPRRKIEGRPAKNGIVRRRITPDLMPDWPEAFLLDFSHARRTFTIETPSEYAIETRVAAHIGVLERAVELARTSHPSG